MPTDESVDSSAADLLTLAVRRPGHAAMAHLLHELDRDGHGDSVPASLQSWHIGAIGEVLVGQELARLSDEWKVLHAIPVGQSADIDHLVIGPAGVFVLNTKRHPGKRVTVGTHLVWINGVQTSGYQRHLRERAVKVGHALGCEETPKPLLVFVDTAQVRQSAEQTVASVRMAALVGYLESQPRILAPEQIEHLHALAASPRTWGRSTTVLHDADPTPRFLRLTEAVPIAPRPLVTRSTSIPGVRRAPSRTRSTPERLVPRCLIAALLGFGAPITAILGVGLLSTIMQALVNR